jgi:hypothetical protein
MGGAITPLPFKTSWRGSQLKNTGTTLTLHLSLIYQVTKIKTVAKG